MMVHNDAMPTRRPAQRQTVSLPGEIARRIKALARARRSSISHTVARLIEAGLEAEQKQRTHYLDLIERLAANPDADERARIKQELARLTFGA